MGRQNQTVVRDFDLLSAPMQRRLQARVAEQNNNVGVIQQDVDAQLAALDRQGEPREAAARRRYQAERALLIAQRTFLTTLGHTVHSQTEQREQRVAPWYRLRRN
jgi:hypothetical protein